MRSRNFRNLISAVRYKKFNVLYVGHTGEELQERMSKHRYDCKRTTLNYQPTSIKNILGKRHGNLDLTNGLENRRGESVLRRSANLQITDSRLHGGRGRDGGCDKPLDLFIVGKIWKKLAKS